MNYLLYQLGEVYVAVNLIHAEVSLKIASIYVDNKRKLLEYDIDPKGGAKMIKNELNLTPVQVRDACNNAGMPDIAEKVWTNDDILNLSENDVQRIKEQIADFDSYYKEGWKESETRKHLVSLVG